MWLRGWPFYDLCEHVTVTNAQTQPSKQQDSRRPDGQPGRGAPELWAVPSPGGRRPVPRTAPSGRPSPCRLRDRRPGGCPTRPGCRRELPALALRAGEGPWSGLSRPAPQLPALASALFSCRLGTCLWALLLLGTPRLAPRPPRGQRSPVFVLRLWSEPGPVAALSAPQLLRPSSQSYEGDAVVSPMSQP